MRLKIVTPAKVVFDDEVESIQGKSTDGEFGILPKHVPLATPLDIAILKFVKNGQPQTAAVMGGMFYTDGQSATVLSDTAELAQDIDITRAQQAKERAEARLREKNATLDYKRAEMSLSRAMIRLKVKS